VIIKICGFTNADDARFAINAGADWVGLNMVRGPRRIDEGSVVAILDQLPDRARAVVLLEVGADGTWRSTVGRLRARSVTRVQLYGDVTAEVIREIEDEGITSIVARGVDDGASLMAIDAWVATCEPAPPKYLLADAADSKRWGGTGQRIDWELLRRGLTEDRRRRWPAVILAGGLTPHNVAEAIRNVSPAGVDVCSGVESQPGRKDHLKVGAFIAAARRSAPGGLG
jgi:phosphoribosylanthranilate isomerase